MSSILGKIPKFTLKLPSALAKAGRTMSECPLELSFSLCDDGACPKKAEEQIPLQVKLPQDPEKQNILLINREAHEKAEEEMNEKQQDNMEVTCSVSVDGQEKQEFFFTLYEFDTCDRTNKEDVEKVVVRSICEALNKTLKLPPSGSRTIKVKLAISPDGSKESDTKESQEEAINWPTIEPTKVLPPSKLNDCCSAQSANTTSTYLPSSLSEKPPKYSSPSVIRSPHLVHKTVPSDPRNMPSPKLRPARYRPHKSEQKNHLREKLNLRMHAVANRHQLDNVGQSVDDESIQFPKQQSSRDHVPECRDRRNHYLDLAGVESPKRNNLSHPNYGNESPRLNSSVNNHHQGARIDSKYSCAHHLLDRTHGYSRSHRTRDAQSSSPLKKSLNCHPKLNVDPEDSPRLFRTKFIPDPDDDLLNLNYDLCDLVPEAKFDWEKQNHRRSKSYDLYENNFTKPGGFYSPKLKPRNNQNWTPIVESQKFSNHMPSSPGHHYRHRNRDKSDKQRMQEVAHWIQREHSNAKAETTKHFVRSTMSPSTARKQAVERHEHHYLHEHVHHHYHHFVEF